MESNIVKCKICPRYRQFLVIHVKKKPTSTSTLSNILTERYTSLLQILCVHLKRFRHELMFSTKISTHVSFPLEGLDLQPFLICKEREVSVKLKINVI